MRRLAFSISLVTALSACGFGAHVHPGVVSLGSKATTRQCISRLELRGSGHALSGSGGDFKQFPSTKRFSDNRVYVEWLLEPRALSAQITNRTESAITIDSVIVGYDKHHAASPVMRLGPGSSQRIRLASLAESQEYVGTPRTIEPGGRTNELHVELGMHVGDQACSYEFQLVPELDHSRLPPWLVPLLDDPIRNPAVRAIRIAGDEPEYPETARRARINGIVILEIIIEADGRVSSTRVLKPLPFGLNQAAVAAVRTWQYRPAQNHGKPVRSVQNVPVRFTPPDPAPCNSTQQLARPGSRAALSSVNCEHHGFGTRNRPRS